jgi:hypothetical protein
MNLAERCFGIAIVAAALVLIASLVVLALL